jgi:hypothetical protein
MNVNTRQAIGPDRPLGDREGAVEDWSPETVEEISKDEVKNPADQPEPDIEESEEDPSKD